MPDKDNFHGVVVPNITGALDTELNTKLSTQAAQSGFLVPTQHPDEVSPTVTAKWSKGADTPPGGTIDNGNMIPVGIDLFNQEETGEVHVPLRTAQGHGAPAVLVDQKPWRMAKAPMSKTDDSRWEESEAHPTLNTFSNHGENRLQSAVTIETKQMYENHGTDSRVKEVEVSPTIPARAGTGGNNVPLVGHQVIPIHDQATRHSGKRGDKQDGKGNGLGIGKEGDPANTLTKNDRHAIAHSAVRQDLVVRRLTPTECERLQGFPDGWTKIPWKGKPAEKCPDGPRFKAMGNSMAVPVMRWIGEGIELVNRIPRTEAHQQAELGWL